MKRSIIPQPYSHQVKMNILIKKGQQSGTALIPCTIYAMDHSIDLNPALIRKKDKKRIRNGKIFVAFFILDIILFRFLGQGF